MTIREAKSMRELLNQITPFSMAFLSEAQCKSVVFLRVQVEKKAKKYPKYFKVTT